MGGPLGGPAAVGGLSEGPLARLLDAMASGRDDSAADLAGRLRVDPEQLRLMLRELAALGLVTPAPLGQACPAPSAGEPACHGCPVAATCPLTAQGASWSPPAGLSWRLTPRGWALVRRSQPSPLSAPA